jgi:hypothetical protein
MSRLVLATWLAVTALVAEAGCVLEVNGQFSAYRCEDGSAGRSDDLGRLPPEASRVTGGRGGYGVRDFDGNAGDSPQLALPAVGRGHAWVKAQPW